MTDARAGITDRFADFIVSMRYEDLPPQAIADGKQGILDTLGVAIVGSVEPATRMAFKACAETGGQSTLIGMAARASPPVAALVNGYAAHTLNYDDSQHRVETTHMSSPVLPAALAVAESQHRSGKALLTGYLVGFEVGCRLGRAERFAVHLAKRGINANAVLGHFGAVAAAGKLMGLDQPQMKRALGIVAAQAMGLMASSGTMAKAQQAANAAHDGVYAASLAHLGFTAPEDIFDGQQNLFAVFGAETNVEALFRDLGQDFEISHNTVKVYACAGWRNPIMAAAMLLAAEHNLRPELIRDLRIQASAEQMRLPNFSEPKTGLEAKFSAQYAAAVALVDRAGAVPQFSDQRVADPVLQQLTRKTTLETDEKLASFQIRLTIHTTDGRELSHFIPIPKGDHLNPLTWEDLAGKFRANSLPVLPPRQIDTLVARIRNIEMLEDVGELMQLLRLA